MGFFRNKGRSNKKYTLEEALRKMKQPQYENSTLIDAGEGTYHIIPMEESKKIERQLRESERMKVEFHQRINGKGKYAGIGVTIADSNEYERSNQGEREIG